MYIYSLKPCQPDVRSKYASLSSCRSGCLQEAEQREAALLKELAARDEKERALQTEKAALEKRLTEAVDAKIGAAAAKANTARSATSL